VVSAPAADCGITSPSEPAVHEPNVPTTSDGLARSRRLSIDLSKDFLCQGVSLPAAFPPGIASGSRLDNWFSSLFDRVLRYWIRRPNLGCALAFWFVFLGSGTQLFGFQDSLPAGQSELPRKRPPSVNGAQQPKVAPPQKGETVFHTLELADGTRLVGLVLGDNPSEIFYACRREWMRTNDPKYAMRAEAIALEEGRAYEQLRDRLKPLVETSKNEKHGFFIQQEFERAQNWLDSETHSESELVLLILPKREVKRLQLPDTSRRLGFFNTAVWAWNKHLSEPETTTATSVREELQKQGIGLDLIADTPDLGRRFQAIPQSDPEWSARMALVAFSRLRAIEFQGTQGMSIRIEPGKEADVASILQKTLSRQTGSLLGELLGDKISRKDRTPPDASHADASHGPQSQDPLAAGTAKRWYDTPRSQLSHPDEYYFRTTDVTTDVLLGSVSVRSAFVVKMPDGIWSAVWKTEIDGNASQGRTDSIRQLNEDPQIQSLKNLLGGLGLASDENLNKALEAGAATMQAQQDANHQFEKFRQRYLNQLDLPILRWDPN